MCKPLLRGHPGGRLSARLSALLATLELDGLQLWCGDPSQLDIVRVRAFAREARSPPAPGTLYLVPADAKLEDVLTVARPRADVAFLFGGSENGASAHRFAGLRCPVLWTSPAIPLDLGARVQELIDRAESPSLGGDAIARARQDLVEDLVLGRYQDVAAVARRARGLGMALEDVTTVLLVGFSDFERYFLQNEAEGELYFQRLKGTILALARRVAANAYGVASVTPHAEGAVVLGNGPLEALGRELAARLRKELRFVPVAVAVGTARSGMAEVLHSYQEARLALTLRKKLRLQSRYIAFHDVVGHALLQRITHAPEIASMLEAEMQALREAESRNDPVLVRTIAAYYDSGGSLKRAAADLGIHPKTLRYRLDRAEEVLGEGSLHGDKRLLYHLAARYLLWVDG